MRLIFPKGKTAPFLQPFQRFWMTLRTRIRNSTSSRSERRISPPSPKEKTSPFVDTSLGRGLARPTITQLKALSRLLLYRFILWGWIFSKVSPILFILKNSFPLRALIEEWQYRFGLAFSLLSEGCSYSYSNPLYFLYLPLSLVLEVLKFQSRCNGLDFTLAIIAIWVNCLTIYPKGKPCPCGFPLLHRANLTLCAFLGGLPSFSIPLLYILARLCLRLCVCRFNWCCETEKDGSTWIPILILFLVLHSSIE